MGIASQCVHGIGVCVIPRPENNHRPLALRHKPLALLSTLLIMVKLATVSVVGLTPTYAELSTITTNRIIQLTNAERIRAGLPPLTISSALTSAAQEKAQHMLDEDYFAHISPSGITPWFWMAKHNYSYQIAGENLAIDFTEAEDVVKAWIASPSHKANLLHPEYTQTGVAVLTGEFQGGESTVVVHMFGKPTGANVAAEVIDTLPEIPPRGAEEEEEENTAAPADTTPPMVPKISLPRPSSTVQDIITMQTHGEAGSSLHVLINNQERFRYTYPLSGSLDVNVSVSDYPDGTLIIRAYSKDGSGNQSALSEPLSVIKDTQGPAIAAETIQYILDPAFDNARVILALPKGEFDTVTTEQAGTISEPSTQRYAIASALSPINIVLSDTLGNTTTLKDIRIAPQISTDPQQYELATPKKLSQLYHRLTAGVLLTLLTLLVLAVLIQIRIQHPSLIGHTSLVILLAGTLLLM